MLEAVHSSTIQMIFRASPQKATLPKTICTDIKMKQQKKTTTANAAKTAAV